MPTYVIPITIKQTEQQLNEVTQLYYSISDSGSDEEISNCLTMIANLQLLKSEFLSGNPYSVINQIANSYFDIAISNPTDENKENAFSAFSSYTSYIKNNSIGYDTNTNSPIFPTGEKIEVYDKNGDNLILSQSGE